MDTSSESSTQPSARALIGAFAGVLAVWLILFLRGFPFPHIDDLYYSGAGINLGMGGKLINPLIENLGPFYSYPPIHSYVTAVWFWIFGVSARSMAAFYCTMGIASTWCVLRAFQILKKPLLGYLTAIALLLFIISVGIRPDTCGLFLLSISFRLGVSPRLSTRGIAPLFAFLGLLALPASLGLAIPWVLYLVSTDKAMWKWTIAGGLIAGGLVIFLIGGNITAFLHGFFACSAAGRAIQTRWVKTTWYKPMGIIKIIYPLVSIFLLELIAIRRRGFKLLDALICISILLGHYATWNSASGHRVTSLITIIAIGLLAYDLFADRKLANWLILGNAAIIILSGLRPLAQGLTESIPTNGPELLAEVNRLAPSRIIVDEWTLRYVFDYRLRPGMIADDFGDRPGTNMGKITTKYPDECWVFSAQGISNYSIEPHGLQPPKFLMISGKPIGNWMINAGEMGVSPPGQ